MKKTYKNPGKIEFDASINQSDAHKNSWGWVEFNYDTMELFGAKNLIPIKVTFDGINYRGSLAKMGSQFPMLLIRRDIMAQLNKKPGEKVHVTVELDTEERKVNLAADTKAALKKAGLQEIFDKLSFTHRREYNTWIEDAKKPETRTNRLAKMVTMLKSGIKNP